MNTIMRKSRLSAGSGNRAGTALLLVISLLAMLAVIAMTFITTSRTEHMAMKNIAASKHSDQAVQATIQRIMSIMSDDLWGHIEDTTGAESIQQLLGLPRGANGVTTIGLWTAPTAPDAIIENEPWDAPSSSVSVTATEKTSFAYWDPISSPDWQIDQVRYDGDPWLSSMNIVVNASSELTSGQVTDLTLSDWNELLPANKIVRADADGDGEADSIWYDLGLATPDGLRFRAAVRIIDNAGMVNVNTAWQWPSDVYEPNTSNPDPKYFLGDTLAGVNLYNVNLAEEYDIFVFLVNQ